MERSPDKPAALVAFLGTAPRGRIILTLASATLAIYLGFVAFNAVRAQAAVYDYGYYLIFFTFGWFLYLLWKSGRESPGGNDGAATTALFSRWRELFRPPLGWATLAILGCTLLCLLAEPLTEKILYDEHVIEATAMHMHHTRNVATVVRGYDVNGVFLSVNHYLDKRPYFYALLLSLVHDVVGYRPANVHGLNAALTAFTLTLLFVVARRLGNTSSAILAVLLFGTLPLLGQNATGAGLEILNLAMILLCLWLGIRAVEQSTETRLGAFVLGVVLLAQTRYESSLYVVAVAVVLVVVWWREQRLILPWPVVATPLLLVPIPLVQLVLTANPIMWDLPPNLHSRFGVDHLRNNLEHARNFLFGFSADQPNSLLLVLLGLAGAALCAFYVVRRPARLWHDPARWVTAAFAVIIMGNLGLLMFYFWGELDDPMVSRLALPLYVLLVCCAAAAAGALDRSRPVSRWGIAAALVALPLTYGRATPLHLYSSENLTAAEIRWEKRWMAELPPGSRLVLTNKSSLPWLLQHEPALLISLARDRTAEIAFHFREGTFAEILVTQRMRATSPTGDFQVDPEDRLPAGFQLETLVEKRFGQKLDRISRLTAVDLPVAPAVTP